MAHETLTRADLAAWGASPILTAAELWHLDQKGYRAINGDHGGTWAPTGPLTIGGSGLTMAGPFIVQASGSFACSADAEFNALCDITSTGSLHIAAGASCSIEGATSFESTSDPQVASGCTFTFLSGSSLIGATGSFAVLGGANTLLGTNLIIGATTFNGACDPVVGTGCAWTWQSGSSATWQSGSNLVFDSGSQVTGSLALAATVTQTERITKSGSGARVVERLANCTTNSDNVVTVNADVYFYTQTTATTRTLRLRDATAPIPVEGEKLTIHIDMSTPGSTDQVTIENETSGDLLVSFQRGTPGTSHHYLMAVFRSGTWRCVMHQGNATAIGVAA